MERDELCVHAFLIKVLHNRSNDDLPAVRTKPVDEYDVRAVGVALARDGVTAPKLIRGVGAMSERGKERHAATKGQRAASAVRAKAARSS
jgi:hypothetical protein